MSAELSKNGTAGHDIELGIAGFRYSDLFDAKKLAELAEAFYSEVDARKLSAATSIHAAKASNAGPNPTFSLMPHRTCQHLSQGSSISKKSEMPWRRR
jgi:hypothetical protein